MKRKLRRPRPATLLALLALFVALSGNGYAAQVVPLAKRALSADRAKTADTARSAATAKLAERAKLADRAKTAANAETAANASRLEGKSAAEVAALVQIPPASSVAHLVTLKKVHWSIPPHGQVNAVAACDAGQKVVGGGWDNPNGPTFGFDSKPTADGNGWVVYIINPSGSIGAEGEVYALCLK